MLNICVCLKGGSSSVTFIKKKIATAATACTAGAGNAVPSGADAWKIRFARAPPFSMKTTKKSMNSIRKEKTNMKAIITRNDQTAILELSTSRMKLAGSLSRIGVRTPAYIIPCSDEEEDYIKVKLFGESDFENELTALVTPKDSVGSVNTALDLYRGLPRTQKEKLNVELSQNPPDSLSLSLPQGHGLSAEVCDRGLLFSSDGLGL